MSERLLAIAVVNGALTSAFGNNFRLDHHSHVHKNIPGSDPQTFHKDGSMRGKPRGHRPRLGLVMYYPGGCDDEMGPTSIQ